MNARSYDVEIELPYGKLQGMIDWCDTNISHVWHYEVLNTAGKDSGSYRFCFRSDIDYTKFLIWMK